MALGRLGAAKARAQAVGLEGALWPWESAVLGSGVELNIIK